MVEEHVHVLPLSTRVLLENLIVAQLAFDGTDGPLS
jgi:hypothetical protein